MATLALACKRLHAPASPILSLQLYRALRALVGPVLAWLKGNEISHRGILR